MLYDSYVFKYMDDLNRQSYEYKYCGDWIDHGSIAAVVFIVQYPNTPVPSSYNQLDPDLFHPGPCDF